MKCLSVHALTFFLIIASQAIAEPKADEKKSDGKNAVTIPLDEVWAYKMPGTQPLTDAQKIDEEPTPEGQLVFDIRRSLDNDPKRKVAKKGFAVEGTGIDALREAHRILTTDAKPQALFAEGTPVSVVFFSYESGRYVQIREISRTDEQVKILYDFVPHESQETTEHFAIIPLGELKAGTYKVRIENEPLDKKNVESGFKSISEGRAKQIVCRSFSFGVKQKPAE